MHQNSAFRADPDSRNRGFAGERGFGTLCVSGAGGPLLAHVPFRIDATSVAELHLMRSNPIARAVQSPTPAVMAVNGPDGYVSPDWYGAEDQVPTWNYVAVHLRGTLVPLPQEALRAVLDRLSEEFENRLLPKRPWSAAKMDPATLDRMMRQIRPFRLDIATVEGTWKLNQNKPASSRMGAAAGVEAYGIGQETRLLAALMRGAGEEPSP